MSAIILDGKRIAKNMREIVAEKIKKHCLNPKFVIVTVGEDPASKIYTNNKIKACQEVGIDATLIKMSEDTGQYELQMKLKSLSDDPNIDAIILQLPIPYGLNPQKAIDFIDPSKDVDCLTTYNKGKILNGLYGIAPCTPGGIIKLLDCYGISLEGKNVTIVGRSNIVGKPLSVMMGLDNATVTLCHSKTKNLKQHTINADIIVSAVGKPNTITADMIKDGAIVIDVGINRVNGKIIGDVDFENVKDKASYITPVPGGIGPMTVARLLNNIFFAAFMNVGNKNE